MEPSGIFAIFIVVAMFGIFARLLAGGMDKERVRAYIQSQGGRMLDTQWTPFGKGWVGEKNARIYRIQFEDRFGNIREATVKTNMFSGVYFTDDIVVVPAGSQQPPEYSSSPASPVADPLLSIDAAELDRLRTENARLKEELARARNAPQPLFSSEADETRS